MSDSDRTDRTFTTGLRVWSIVNHFIVWISSIIVTGILSYFLRITPFSNYVNRTHIIYEEVIAVITLAFWTFFMFLPLIKRYRGYLWPVNLIMSYLWITSFIFSTQDWAGGRCSVVGPVFGRCNQKRAAMAFNFLAFFCLLVNVLVEEKLYRTYPRTTDAALQKDRTRATGDGTNGTSATAAQGQGHTVV